MKEGTASSAGCIGVSGQPPSFFQNLRFLLSANRKARFVRETTGGEQEVSMDQLKIWSRAS